MFHFARFKQRPCLVGSCYHNISTFHHFLTFAAEIMHRPTSLENQNLSSTRRRESRIRNVTDKSCDFRYDEKENSVTVRLPLRKLLTSNAKLSFSSNRTYRPRKVSGGNTVLKNDFRAVGTPQYTCSLLARLQEINSMHSGNDVVTSRKRDIENKRKKAVSFDPNINRWHNGSGSHVDVPPLLPSRGKALVTLQ
jgi:hypothetical protein